MQKREKISISSASSTVLAGDVAERSRGDPDVCRQHVGREALLQRLECCPQMEQSAIQLGMLAGAEHRRLNLYSPGRPGARSREPSPGPAARRRFGRARHRGDFIREQGRDRRLIDCCTEIGLVDGDHNRDVTERAGLEPGRRAARNRQIGARRGNRRRPAPARPPPLAQSPGANARCRARSTRSSSRRCRPYRVT